MINKDQFSQRKKTKREQFGIQSISRFREMRTPSN